MLKRSNKRSIKNESLRRRNKFHINRPANRRKPVQYAQRGATLNSLANRYRNSMHGMQTFCQIGSQGVRGNAILILHNATPAGIKFASLLATRTDNGTSRLLNSSVMSRRWSHTSKYTAAFARKWKGVHEKRRSVAGTRTHFHNFRPPSWPG